MSNIVPFDFDKVLALAVELPSVKIEREEFLQKYFSSRFDREIVARIVQTSPIRAGVNESVLYEIARECINYEKKKVSALSFATGSGGFVGIPADLAQYMAHVLRISQKLAYIYGYPEIRSIEGSMDEKTQKIILLFIGVMYGVSGANKVIAEISKSLAGKVGKDILRAALTKTAWYPLLKQCCKQVGIKVTKDALSKIPTKVVPGIGGVVSAGFSYYCFGKGAARLHETLRKNPVR
ncbi:MAG: EcsC family protein [Phascolarctobacterium succinatutens]|uniref:EcsC family protein n=1 Tax=Phascolarctobacterium succinatutens TaxID=626940 RepID=UPI0023F34CEC|nr:EcsC family protein [Phascolarctobacterium succinatutens]MCI6543232.1 EcsC family protein [Phascolarctobacterium succinatutens]